jgi:hypothetical protein
MPVHANVKQYNGPQYQGNHHQTQFPQFQSSHVHRYTSYISDLKHTNQEAKDQ